MQSLLWQYTFSCQTFHVSTYNMAAAFTNTEPFLQIFLSPSLKVCAKEWDEKEGEGEREREEWEGEELAGVMIVWQKVMLSNFGHESLRWENVSPLAQYTSTYYKASSLWQAQAIEALLYI